MYRVISIDLPNSIRLVLAGRAYALVTDGIVGERKIKEMNLYRQAFCFSDVYLDSTPLYAAVRKTHPQAQKIVGILNAYFGDHAASDLKVSKQKYGLTHKQ